TVKAAVPFAAGGAGVAAVSASIAALTEGVLKSMLLTKLKLGAVVLLTLGTVVLGVGAIVNQVLAHPAAATREARPPEDGAKQGSADARALDNTKRDDVPDQSAKTKDRKADTGDRRFRAEETITKSFKTKGTARLVVETFNGPVEVKIGDKGAVKATVVKSTREKSEEAAKEDVKNVEETMTQEGHPVRVTARPADPKSPGERGASVEVEVPAGAVLDLRTHNGPVKVNGATGDVTADTANGAIHVRGGKGKV